MVLVILTLLFVCSLTFADGAPKGGEFGVQGALVFTTLGLGSVGDLGITYMFADDFGMRADLGIVNSSSGGSSAALFDLGVGIQYYFGNKGGVSPYVGGELSYGGEFLSTGATTPSIFGVAAVLGGEYFFSSNFTWSGELRLGFVSYNNGTATTTSIGTLGVASYLTWYIN